MSSAGDVFSFVLFFSCRYYCAGGAVTPTPSDGITGGPCPEGFYCPEGTVQPVPCKPGTFSAVTRATHCDPCLPGWFCLSGSLYLCPAGLLFFNAPKITLTFVFHLYTNYNGAKSLKKNYRSHYPTSLQNFVNLSRPGFYCPEGTGFDQRSCPEGTYGPDPGYWSDSQCRQCDGGQYCSSKNSTTVSGPCQEGFYCTQGNTSPQPLLSAEGELFCRL